MGNTSTSLGGKDVATIARQPRGSSAGATGHNDLPLRDRFEALAKPVTSAADSGGQNENSVVGDGSSSVNPAHDVTGAVEKFVLFEDCSKLVGPRGVQVAARLYMALDAGGDGRLDFEEFSSAACLLKGSPEEDKRQLLFKMYSDAHKTTTVGRDGLMAFMLDMIAASPPPSEPPEYTTDSYRRGAAGRTADHLKSSSGGVADEKREARLKLGQDGEADGWAHAYLDFEVELKDVLDRMAGVVLAEYDADKDGSLSEKEWKAYLMREEEGVRLFLSTLSDSVGKLLLE